MQVTVNFKSRQRFKVIFKHFESFGILYLPTVMVHYDVRMIML